MKKINIVQFINNESFNKIDRDLLFIACELNRIFIVTDDEGIYIIIVKYCKAKQYLWSKSWILFVELLLFIIWLILLFGKNINKNCMVRSVLVVSKNRFKIFLYVFHSFFTHMNHKATKKSRNLPTF